MRSSRLRRRWRTGRIALLAALVLWQALPAWAGESQPPFPVGSKFSRALQRWTGINLLTELVAGQVAKMVLRHELGGKVGVKVKTFSLTDLVAGKIKKVELRLSGSAYRGVPLGSLRLATANPVWVRYRRQQGQRPGLRMPVLLATAGTVRETDISSALKSPLVASNLRMVKLDLPGLGEQQLQFVDPQVDLEGGLVRIRSTLVTAGAQPDSGVSILIAGKPQLEGDSRIVVSDLQTQSPDIIDPDKFAAFAQDLLNPLIDFSKLDRLDHAFRLQTLKVGDEAVEFSGNLLVAPKVARVAQQVVNKR